jgi:hypothetical protein
MALPPSASLARFFRLLNHYTGDQVFNPWTEYDPGTDLHHNAASARRQRLRAHLATKPTLILIGEAAGYQGCHVTGIPFTSERLLIAGRIPRVHSRAERLSSRHIPWSEPSATTIWSALHEFGIAQRTILWNAFPWHPYKSGNRQSNRTPKPAERAMGIPVLKALVNAFPSATVAAVGRHAEASLVQCGVMAHPLRHPSMGGVGEFRRGLKKLIRG